jgi:glucose-6-phosphate isomerase
MLALLGIWNQNFLGLRHQVVLPYDQRLEKLPAYLQQLFMESLGKSVRQNGDSVAYRTGGALWGGVGANAQHSYAQWLHQGAADAHVDFVASVNGPGVLSAQAQLQNLANLVAQADVLACGKTSDEVLQAFREEGVDADTAKLLLPHKVHPGNRSSLVILLRELNPFNLGMLIALYEHQVYVQASIWGINAFDQWGVELGKQRARKFAAALTADDLSAQKNLPALGRQILRWRR